MGAWRRLAPQNQLVLRNTLLNGQCFGWRRLDSAVPADARTSLSQQETKKGSKSGQSTKDKEIIAPVVVKRERGAKKRKLEEQNQEQPSVKLEPGEIGVALAGVATTCQGQNDSYLGVIGPWAIQLREREGFVWFRTLNKQPVTKTEQIERCLRDYFQLDAVDLVKMYSEWGAACRKAAAVGQVLPGMRILRQDPLECLISFICSSNNNIARITMMLNRLRENFGDVVQVEESGHSEDEDGLLPSDLKLYQFPTLKQLGGATEPFLREQGFGYRAKYIAQVRKKKRKNRLHFSNLTLIHCFVLFSARL